MQPLAARTLSGLFDASLQLDLRRLPELFCGFTRNPGDAPTLNPQACSPQACAAAAPLLCLQACLGIEVDAAERRVSLHKPFLPDFLHRICIEGPCVQDARLDLEITRHQHDVGVRLTHREGDVRVSVQM
jgi:glycogen debranching enzyme